LLRLREVIHLDDDVAGFGGRLREGGAALGLPFRVAPATTHPLDRLRRTCRPAG
jgi:hypothetical protein